jgi:hypothetical protein
MARKTKSPWQRPNPRKQAGKPSKHLTSAQKTAAKARARRAGRRYPNLVDNMTVAAKAPKKTTSKKKARKRGGRRAAHKKDAKKTSANFNGTA